VNCSIIIPCLSRFLHPEEAQITYKELEVKKRKKLLSTLECIMRYSIFLFGSGLSGPG
jgi:hypothetical protein